MKKYKTTKEEFMKQNYITCPYCQYNNEKGRFSQYGKCLNCGEILDPKMHFMIEMLKKAKDDKRRRG